MTTNQATFIINTQKCSIGSQCEHTITINPTEIILKGEAKKGSGIVTRTSDIIIPLNLPKSAIIDSIVFPSINERKPTSLVLIVDDQRYETDLLGNVTNAQAYSYLNNYKAQHGVFPSLILRISSELDATYATVGTNDYITSPKITCTIEGGEVTLRPCADVSVEHEIKDGFSGVYQLVNEVSPDDDTTYIGDLLEPKEVESVESKTSIVKLDMLPKPVKVININLTFRAEESRNGVYGHSYAKIWLAIDGAASTEVTTSTDSSSFLYDKYITHEYSLDFEDSFTKAINTYYEQNGTMPEISAHLFTYVTCAAESGKTSAIDVKITQAYASIIYEHITNTTTNVIYYKIGNTWKPVAKTYQKQNGAWVEITKEECKAILHPA